MAIPLAVTEQPLAPPFTFTVAAEAVVLYPGNEAESVQSDYYFNDPLDRIEVFDGGEAYNDGCAPPSSSVGECEIPEPVIFSGGFSPIAGLSALYFRWVDVADFFWYWPDGDAVLEFEEPEVTGGVDVGQDCLPLPVAVSAVVGCDPPTVIDPDGSVSDGSSNVEESWNGDGAVWNGGLLWS
jgi:hypothetical protein